ncbi:hypothetical protein DMA11_18265 [Marinilabiliaceae bacterium JC017]|nr:hypothetical protein DMA11_18265 [Marinilabiliaceae bacterium JC017]
MKPHIDSTSFGSITIADTTYDHDVFISLNGSVHKRKKKLSKKTYGTSHIISEEELQHILEEDTSLLIIGSGQSGMVGLSNEAKALVIQHDIEVYIKETPKAIEKWNSLKERAIGLFHVTC